jgi:hypothetical protein
MTKMTTMTTRNHLEKFKKSRHFPQEITALSSGNHGNFLKKSRQLLTEKYTKRTVPFVYF